MILVDDGRCLVIYGEGRILTFDEIDRLQARPTNVKVFQGRLMRNLYEYDKMIEELQALEAYFEALVLVEEGGELQ